MSVVMQADHDTVYGEYLRYAEGQTTHQGLNETLGYQSARRLLGPMYRRRILDFGCNCGQQSRILAQRGACVTGVDLSMGAIRQAIALQGNAEAPIRYLPYEPGLLPAHSFDATLVAFVTCCIGSRDEVQGVLQELHRVLRPGGAVVLLNNNPERALGCEFESFALRGQAGLHSGAPYVAVLKGTPVLEVQNYFWSRQDYDDMLAEAGFRVTHVEQPQACTLQRRGSLASVVSPFLLVRAVAGPSPAR